MSDEETSGSGAEAGVVRRRDVVLGAALLSAGAASALAGCAAMPESSAQMDARLEESMSYPPYPTSAAAEAAYAQHISRAHAGLVGAGGRFAALNIHYGVRENGRVQDVYTGKWFWDCHRLGTKFNLGHQNPVLLAAMTEAMKHINSGNWLQLSGYRAKLAEKLAASTRGVLGHVTFGVSGAEANEIAIHAARNHTGRTKLVAIADIGFHGSTDLALSVSGIGAEWRARYRVQDQSVIFVPFNNLAAMAAAISNKTAAVILEPSPAQGGFPVPAPGYLKGVEELCRAKGALLVVDEVQTGVGACGTVWGYQKFGFTPDIITAGKGLGGGIYPMAAALMREEVWRSYTDGQLVPHDSTYAGSELGCVVACAVLDLTDRPEFLDRVNALGDRFRRGFSGAPWGFDQVGLNLGIHSTDPYKTAAMLTQAGVFCIPSPVAPVVPFRPVLTLSDADADEIISIVRATIR
jgi:acetylornithine aminotransferase